jgi:peptidoglycan/xylan/chitin deacetylase (PgdA/CDA1 family)
MREGVLKSAAFAGLRATGLLALAERLRAGATVLAYHGVTNATSDATSGRNRRRLHVPTARFEEHLRALKAHATPIALPMLLEHLEQGRALPPRAVVLTFDDGYRNFATAAWPALERAGVPATLFVVTDAGGLPFWQDRLEAAVEASPELALTWNGNVWPLASQVQRERAQAAWLRQLATFDATARTAALDELVERLGGPGDVTDDDRQRLSWDDLRALHARGLDVGSHADRHEPLTDERPACLGARLSSSLGRLSEELGPGRYTLAYPYGGWSATVVAAARGAGFRAGFTTAPRLVRPADDLWCLGRFLVGADDDVARLRVTLAGLRALWQRDGGAA